MNLVKETILLPALYSVTAEAEEQRNQIALRGVAVKAVANAADNEAAGAVVRDIRAYVKSVEAMRQALTKPLLEGQRLLKALADDHCAPLLAEQRRIEGLAVAFAQAEARRVAREEEERQAAYRKAEQERIEAEEKARKLAEKANTEKQQVAAIKAAQAAEAKAAEVAQVIAAPMPTVNRVKGQQTKPVLMLEVTDVAALAAARPDLVTFEPKVAVIKGLFVPESPNLPPGIRMWWETKVVFSSSTGRRF